MEEEEVETVERAGREGSLSPMPLHPRLSFSPGPPSLAQGHYYILWFVCLLFCWSRNDTMGASVETIEICRGCDVGVEVSQRTYEHGRVLPIPLLEPLPIARLTSTSKLLSSTE